MGFFSTPQTKTIELPGAGNRATVRKLSYAEQQRVISEASRIEFASGKAVPVVDVGKLHHGQTRLSVCDWEGPDFEGRPCTPQNVDALPSEIGNLLQEAAEEINTTLGEEEKKA